MSVAVILQDEKHLAYALRAFTTWCKYYSPHGFSQLKRHLNMSSYSNSSFSFFHTNIQSLKRHLENFQSHLLDELTFRFNILGITETRIKSACDNLDFNPTIIIIIITIIIF